MKAVKRLLMLETVCIILCFTVFFEFALMSSSTAYEKTEPRIEKLERTLIKANLSLDGKTLKVRQELLLTMPIDEIFLNVPANILASSTILGISPLCEDIVMLNDNVAMRLSFIEKTASIIIDYEIYLNSDSTLLSYSDNKIILSQFLITPAPIADEKPILSIRSDFGDPFAYDMQDYLVTISADLGFSVFAPGKAYEYTDAGRVTASFAATYVRDFPIVLVKAPRVVKKSLREVEITYVDMPDTHNIVNGAFEFIERKTGFDYPYKEFFIIGADINLSGMELSQMILISDGLAGNPAELKKIITHETFHQWFYGIVGTNQVQEPYMDEGMVCYLTSRALGRKSNLTVKKDKFSLGINAFSSKSEYYTHIYSGGCAVFAELSDTLGSQFDTLLKVIFEKYSGGILKHSDLTKEIALLKASD